MFAIAVAAALNGTSAYQIHRTTEQFRESLLHVRPIKQGGMCVRPQCRQQIHVALVAKIIAQSRTKQFQPSDTALATEPAQSFGIEVQLHGYVLPLSSIPVKAVKARNTLNGFDALINGIQTRGNSKTLVNFPPPVAADTGASKGVVADSRFCIECSRRKWPAGRASSSSREPSSTMRPW